MLKDEGSFILQDNVQANEFLNLEDEKISTSRNWAVLLHEYLEDFPGKQDVLRYVLTANAPETKTTNLPGKILGPATNNELCRFRQLYHRAVVLTHKILMASAGAGELNDYDAPPQRIHRVKKNVEDTWMCSLRMPRRGHDWHVSATVTGRHRT